MKLCFCLISFFFFLFNIKAVVTCDPLFWEVHANTSVCVLMSSYKCMLQEANSCTEEFAVKPWGGHSKKMDETQWDTIISSFYFSLGKNDIAVVFCFFFQAGMAPFKGIQFFYHLLISWKIRKNSRSWQTLKLKADVMNFFRKQ